MELGIYQDMIVSRITAIGLFLKSNPKSKDEVLLPIKQAPKGIVSGDVINVFLYKDSEDRPIATVNKPKLTIGDIARLRVVDENKIGAFVDWGLERDLFLPFKEQTSKVIKGQTYVMGLYLDKSDRLCATMDVSKFLRTDHDFVEKQLVKGSIYKVVRGVGAFVAIEDTYQGLIPQKEFFDNHTVGEEIEARITKIHDDGKLDLSIKRSIKSQIEIDAYSLLEAINRGGGFINLHDKSNPDEIRNRLKMSKKAFKDSVGFLFKRRIIDIEDNGLRLRK